MSNENKIRIGVEVDTSDIQKAYAALRKEAYQSIGQKSDELAKMAKYYTELEQNIQQQIASQNALSQAQTKSTETASRTLKTIMDSAGKQLNTWGVPKLLNGQFLSTFQEMTDAIYDIDKAMNRLCRVTDETNTRYQHFLTNASRQSKELGLSLSGLINQTADWAELGYSLNQSETLAATSMLYANVSGTDSHTAIHDIMTAMKAFKLEAANAIEIVDKLYQLGNESSISPKGLGAGLSDSAAALALAGNSLDQSLALLTALSTITQDASESSDTIKVLSMRLRGASDELKAAGKSTDGMAESTAKLREQILSLTDTSGKGGFDIMLDSNTLQSTYDVMQGISKVWSDISSTDQTALLELIAGKQYGNTISQLLGNIEQVSTALQNSVNSTGSAFQEQERWMQSLEGKTKQFETAFQSLSQTVLDSGFLKGLVGTGTDVINVLDEIIKIFGIFPTLLAGTGIKTFITNFGQLVQKVRVA